LLKVYNKELGVQAMTKTNVKGKHWKDYPWKCVNCGFMLGVLSQDLTELRIKWRDLFISVGEAKYVKIVCRRCSKENILSQNINKDTTKIEHPPSA
jgi:hypothetical protein